MSPKPIPESNGATHFFCSVVDTWGAIVPYIWAMERLQQRGGHCFLCISEEHRQLAEAASLPYVSDSVHQKEKGRSSKIYDTANNALQFFMEARRDIEAWMPQVMRATQEAVVAGRLNPPKTVVVTNSAGIFYLGPFWLELGFTRFACLEPYLLYDWLGIWQNERSQFLPSKTPPWLGRLALRGLFGQHGRSMTRKFLGRKPTHGFDGLRRAVIAQWHMFSPQLFNEPGALGYCYPSNAGGGLSDELDAFLDRAQSTGQRIVLFTIVSMELSEGGMAAMVDAFIEGVQQVPGTVGVVLGREAPKETPEQETIFFQKGFVPFQTLFPRANLIVCHGGTGTSHLAMLAGVPVLVVPFLKDQFDRVHRLRRLGMLAGTASREHFNADCVASAIRGLGDDMLQNAQRVGEIERSQYSDGLERVVEGLVGLMHSEPSREVAGMEVLSGSST